MGALKTIVSVLLVFSAGVAAGMPQSPSQRVQLFATCAGRYSALLEHERLFDGATSERAALHKQQFEDLLDAVLPDALDWGMPGHMALDWRLTAKHTQATLLHRGVFHTDRDVAAHAKQISETLLNQCRELTPSA